MDIDMMQVSVFHSFFFIYYLSVCMCAAMYRWEFYLPLSYLKIKGANEDTTFITKYGLRFRCIITSHNESKRPTRYGTNKK